MDAHGNTRAIAPCGPRPSVPLPATTAEGVIRDERESPPPFSPPPFSSRCCDRAVWLLEECLITPDFTVPSVEVLTKSISRDFANEGADKDYVTALVNFISDVKNGETFRAISSPTAARFLGPLLRQPYGTYQHNKDITSETQRDNLISALRDRWRTVLRPVHEAQQATQTGTVSDTVGGIEHTMLPVAALATARLLLDIYQQTNCTGPHLDRLSPSCEALEKRQEEAVESLGDDVVQRDRVFVETHKWESLTALGPPGLTLDDADKTDDNVLRAMAQCFNIDGEVILERVGSIGYYRVAVLLLQFLTVLNDYDGDNGEIGWVTTPRPRLRTLFVWNARVAFVWQNLIAGQFSAPCVSLMNEALDSYANSLKHIGVW